MGIGDGANKGNIGLGAMFGLGPIIGKIMFGLGAIGISGLGAIGQIMFDGSIGKSMSELGAIGIISLEGICTNMSGLGATGMNGLGAIIIGFGDGASIGIGLGARKG